MNSLIIILCILIIAETEILLAISFTTPIPERNRATDLKRLISLNPNFQTTTTRRLTTTSPYYKKSYLTFPIFSTTRSYNPQSKKSLYNYNYNTDTGIQAQEEGYLKNVGTNQEALEAQGSYSYTGNEGNTFEVSYIANENGFHPEGAHLPTVPPLIKKALHYIAEHSEGNGKE